MKPKIVFIILDQFADWEYAPLAAELSMGQSGIMPYEVLYASDSKELKTSIGNIHVKPDLTLEEIPGDAAGLVLVGGKSWRQPVSEPVAPIVRRFMAEGKVVGAICDAARFLGAHGLLNEGGHTANFLEELTEEPLYTNAKGFVAEDAASDRGLVTANGNAPYKFARLMLLALGADAQGADMWYEFYTTDFRSALAKYFPKA